MTSAWGRVVYEAPSGDLVAQAEAIQSLIDELSHVPHLRVETDRTNSVPEGTRAVDVPAVSAVLVAIPPAAVVVQSFVRTLRSWVRRRGAAGIEAGRLKLQLGENVLEIDSADPDTIARAVESWFAVHPPSAEV